MSRVHKNISCVECPSRLKGIFCDLKQPALKELSENKVMNTYKKGHTIFYQGNPPFGLYCIFSGKVKISKFGNDGKETIIRIARAGDTIGHRSLFSDQHYHATAITMEESTICFIDKKLIYRTIQEQPAVAMQFIQRLSMEMGIAETRSASMFQKNVRERLAGLFLTLQKNYGIEEDQRVRLDIKLTREEMASMIGTASETVIRFISEFKDEGLIAEEGKTIFITNQNRLMEFADLSLDPG